MRPRFIVYIAASADGYIADAEGGIDWLAAYDARQYGYDEFIASVGAIVMGRTTYDEVLRQGDWPYPGKTAYVLTSRALPAPPAGEKPIPENTLAFIGFCWIWWAFSRPPPWLFLAFLPMPAWLLLAFIGFSIPLRRRLPGCGGSGQPRRPHDHIRRPFRTKRKHCQA